MSRPSNTDSPYINSTAAPAQPAARQNQPGVAAPLTILNHPSPEHLNT